MGKLLFVNTNRVNGIFAVVICVALVAIGIGLTFEGTYVAVILIPLGLYGSKFFLKMATQRTELYEQGFFSKNIFGGVRGRYADLRSITRSAVRVNGVLNTHIFFTTNSGEKLIISNEKLSRNDDKMQLLLELASTAIAETWMKTMERQTEVVWLTDGSTPLLKIRKEGVLVEGKGSAGFISLNQFNVKQAHGLAVELRNGDQKILSVNSGTANFHVGLVLIAMLETKQRSIAASTSN
jgi:hypothetical protein